MGYARAFGDERFCAYLVASLEYGQAVVADPFRIERSFDADASVFLHPVIRFYREGECVDTCHLLEDSRGELEQARASGRIVRLSRKRARTPRAARGASARRAVHGRVTGPRAFSIIFAEKRSPRDEQPARSILSTSFSRSASSSPWRISAVGSCNSSDSRRSSARWSRESMLGPSVLGALAPEWSAAIFTTEARSAIFMLSQIGLSSYCSSSAATSTSPCSTGAWRGAPRLFPSPGSRRR